MHIWLISAFEPTPIDNTRPMRFMGIADAALALGHQVTFFSNTFRHSTKQFRYNKPVKVKVKEGYNLVFVESPSYVKNISVKRMLSHYQYAKNLIKEAEVTDRPDAIFMSIPPLSSSRFMSEWANKNNIPIFFDIIDPWPDVFLKVIPEKMQSWARFPLLPFYRKIKYALSNSSGITAISNQYISWGKEYNSNVPTACFYPAVPFQQVQENLQVLKPKRKDNNILRITYAGSLASSYDIPTMLEAAKILNNQYPGKTAFDIAGAGPQDKLVLEAQSSLPNVKFLGRLNRNELLEQYAISDIGLMQHVKGATQTVTYKVFDYLSAGLPIINSLQSEVVEMLVENKIGLSHEAGNVYGLVSSVVKFIESTTLLNEYKSNALSFTSQFGDSSVVYKKLVNFIETSI